MHWLRPPWFATVIRSWPYCAGFVRTGTVLEIASGTGEHAVYFATALPHLTWQPSDQDEQARKHRRPSGEFGLPNLFEPLSLDAAASDWPVEQTDAVVAINMVHISPWRATQGLMARAGRVLPDGPSLPLRSLQSERHPYVCEQ